MRKTNYFSVREVKLQANGHTYLAWKVDGRINGTRHRRFFSKREDAEAHKAAKEVQALNEAKVIRTTASHLSSEQLRDAEAALQRLRGRVMAADWLLRTFRDTLTQKTFAESFPIFLEERGRRGAQGREGNPGAQRGEGSPNDGEPSFWRATP
jgi:hypothetical protein